MDDYSDRLLRNVTAVVVPWATRLVDDRLASDGLVDGVSQEARHSAVAEAERLAVDGLTELLTLDAEQQRTNPLTVLRSATVPLSRFLASVGATPVVRDEFDRRSFPDDVFGLAPATWADIDPSLVEGTGVGCMESGHDHQSATYRTKLNHSVHTRSGIER